MKIVVLDGFAVNPGDLSWDFLSQFGEFDVYDKTTESEAAERCSGADAVLTNRAVISADLLNSCPTIRFVCALGTGYDMIDTAACHDYGVVVCNIPAYSSDSVAQLIMTMIMNLTTDIFSLNRAVNEGKWTGMANFQYQNITHNELSGMTLGLIGFGNIGKRVSQMAKGFKMNVVATSKTRTANYDKSIHFTNLNELLKISDIVSISCPLNDETREMVDAGFIAKMKEGAILINTSRGAILNEKDVAEALNSGRLAAAGLDVLTNEPPEKDNPLLHAKNCLITPHIAWTTPQARSRLLKNVEMNIRAFVETGAAVNQIV